MRVEFLYHAHGFVILIDGDLMRLVGRIAQLNLFTYKPRRDLIEDTMYRYGSIVFNPPIYLDIKGKINLLGSDSRYGGMFYLTHPLIHGPCVYPMVESLVVFPVKPL